MNWETLACFGDSITHGARSYLGYPEYLGRDLSVTTGKLWNVVNFAENGITAIGLARRISEQYAHLAQSGILLSTLLIGTNDLKLGTPPEQYEIALEQILIKLRLLTLHGNVLLIRIPALLPGVSLPYKMEMNEGIQQYNEVIEARAAEHQLKVISLSISDSGWFDSVHLNETGSAEAAACISAHVLRERGLPNG